MGVIGIKVVLEAKGADEFTQRGSVKREEQRAENRTLGDPNGEGVRGGGRSR